MLYALSASTSSSVSTSSFSCRLAGSYRCVILFSQIFIVLSDLLLYSLNILGCNCFESHDIFPAYFFRFMSVKSITSCSLQSHDLVLYAVQYSFLALSLPVFQFLPQPSVVLLSSSSLTFSHCLRSFILLILS